jgi:hypothetical protein
MFPACQRKERKVVVQSHIGHMCITNFKKGKEKTGKQCKAHVEFRVAGDIQVKTRPSLAACCCCSLARENNQFPKEARHPSLPTRSTLALMFVQVTHGNVDSRRDEIFIQPQWHQIVNKRRSTSTADVDVFNNNNNK